MSLWGKGDGGEPNWLTPAQKARTFATNAGWVLTQPDGRTQEVLVAMKASPVPLPTIMDTPNITSVFFANTAAQYVRNANGFVTVSFNERVNVTGTPTLAITGSAANAVASYHSGSNTNSLLFRFTVPNTANNTLSIGAQTVTLAGGTVTDFANNSVNAVLSFTANNVQGVAAKGTVKTVVVA